MIILWTCCLYARVCVQVFSVSPPAHSVRGGTLVNLTGSGFSNIGPENQVQIGNLSCSIVSSSFTALSCFTPPAALDLDGLCWGGDDCVNATTSTATPSTVHQVSWGFDVSGASITIAPGDTVQWNWDQSGHHNIVSGTRSSPTVEFSCPFASSGSCSHTFNAVGTFPYHCAPHPGMDAIITVSATRRSARSRRDVPAIDATVQVRVFDYQPSEDTRSDGAWGNWIGGVFDGYDAETIDFVTEAATLDGAWGGWSSEVSTLLRETKYFG